LEDEQRSGGGRLEAFVAQAGVREFFFLDHGKLFPALGDVRVRQALNHAINRKLIASTLCGAESKPTDVRNGSGLEPIDARYLNYYQYDPAKAKSTARGGRLPERIHVQVVSASARKEQAPTITSRSSSRSPRTSPRSASRCRSTRC
jgi:hypothetical protein